MEEGQGEESYAAFTHDLRCGTLCHLSALGSVVSLEWAADGATLLCTQPNELGRPSRVLAYSTEAAATAAADLGGVRGGSRGHGGSGSGGMSTGSGSGSSSSRPVVVFEESDERFFVELGRTKDWRWGE